MVKKEKKYYDPVIWYKNPYSKRQITIGGNTWKKLVKLGKIDPVKILGGRGKVEEVVFRVEEEEIEDDIYTDDEGEEEFEAPRQDPKEPVSIKDSINKLTTKELLEFQLMIEDKLDRVKEEEIEIEEKKK